MTLVYPNPTHILYAGASPVADAQVGKVSWRVGGGWSASARIMGSINMYQDITTAYTVAMTDGLGGSLTTPTLCPAQREHEDVYSVSGSNQSTLELEDLTSFRMRRPNQNFATFLASTTTAMIDALATRAGVTITGDPALYVSEDEAKSAKLAEVLGRIAKIAAMDIVVGTDGVIALSAWETAAGALTFVWSTRRHRVDARNIFTGQRLGKSTTRPPSGEQFYGWVEAGFKSEALTSPLLLAEATDISIAGMCGSWTSWNGDPSNPASGWLMHQDLEGLGNYDVPATGQGTGTATHFTAVVLPPGGVFAGSALTTAVRIRVNGTPEAELPSGVDAEFLYPAVVYGTDTSLGDWPAPDFVDPLFPSQAYAIARRPHILAQLNSAADMLIMTGPLQCGSAVRLLRTVSYGGHTYKTVGIDWDLSANKTTVTAARTWED